MTSFRFKDKSFQYFEGEWPGVVHAAENTARDLAVASGYQAPVGTAEGQVLFGSLHQTAAFDTALAAAAIDTARLEGQYESYLITERAGRLFVIGSDKRGTVYGLYTLLDELGISPWLYWADAADHSGYLSEPAVDLGSAGEIFHGQPSVRYRGIFLNDEAPALTTFVQQFGDNPGKVDDPENTVGQVSTPIHESTIKTSPGFNAKFYGHVFDLILRLKGNYLWPAMWNSSFWIDDPDNARLADEYGVVMGTSHQEFIATPDMEWRQWSSQFTPDGSQEPWDYVRNKDHMVELWRKNLRQRAKYENVFTVGMRGLADSEILPDGTVQENVDYLNKVLLDQRDLFKEAGLVPEDTPQMIVLYKEVEKFYYAGWDKVIPDDIILTLCDDNHGNLRSLPTEQMRQHPGGFGMYYHFDYYGGPRSYRWQDSINLERAREQMSMAWNYGIRQLWVVNVGDLKPLETPIEYWFRMAYDLDEWGRPGDEQRFRRYLAAREFGRVLTPEQVDQVADIIQEYQSIANARRPEWVSPSTFSFATGEWDRLMARLQALLDQTLALDALIPADYRHSFYQFVTYKVRSIYNVFQVMYHLGRNQFGLGDPAQEAELARHFVAADSQENDYYNSFNGGKWRGYGLEFHIGQFTWDTMKEQLEFRKYENEAAFRSTDDRVIDYSFGLKVAEPVTVDPTPVPGVTAILATDFSRNQPVGDFQWTSLPGFGRLGEGLKVQPDVLHSLTPGQDSPYLEYTVSVTTPGRLAIATQWAPSNGTDYHDLTKLQYAIEVIGEEDQRVQVIDTLPAHFVVVNALGNSWAEGVETQVRTVNQRDPRQNISYHRVAAAGTYTIRVYMVDDGLTLEKLVVAELDTPGLPMIDSWPSLHDPQVFDADFQAQAPQAVVSLPLPLVGPTDGSNNTPYAYFGPVAR